MTTTGPTPEDRRTPRALLLLLSAAAAVVAVLGLRELSWLVGPVFLALVIVLLVHPLHGYLRRKGVPEVVALTLLLVAVYGVIAGLAGVIAYSVARLASILPDYAPEAGQLLGQLDAWLSGHGIATPQAREIISSLDVSALARRLTSLLSSVVGFGVNVVFLLSLLLFIGLESVNAGQRLSVLRHTRPRTADALVGFARSTRRFLLITTIFAAIVGLGNTLLLLWLGIPLALLWGVLSAACNYIPYVGFVIGVVPPALLALLGGDWRLMIIIVVAYSLLNAVITSLVPPYFVGEAVGLSITVALISVVFWAWVLGPLGAVLAVPATLLVKAVFVDADPRGAWAEALVGSSRTAGPRRRRSPRPAPPPAPVPQVSQVRPTTEPPADAPSAA
jgi:AI-2 transport protein TqsA